MGETSKSTITTMDKSFHNNGAWIANMNSDHLFSILLLLPVDSILSFTMTCKRFRSLSCSNTLWESICRRDWGSSSVDAIKSSMESKHHELPWMKLYKQLVGLDSVSCRNLADPGEELLFPGPRASHSLNFVFDSLVLFGGGAEGGRHLDDTWVAHTGGDFRSTLKWQKISSSGPSGRFGHTCVAIGDFLVLFGGIKDNGIRQNDTWIGQIVRPESQAGITLSWWRLDVGAIKPPARGAHAACCMGNKMVVHGGIGLYALRLGDTWVLDLSDNLCSGKWREIVTHPSPPARSGHSLTCMGETRTVLFGGRGIGYNVLGDVWIFNMGNGFENWVQIMYELRNIPEGVSLARVGHSATLILGGRVLICGGEDSYTHRKDDFWVLDVKAAKSINNNLEKSCIWKKLKIKGYAPKGRSFHRACKDRAGRYLYVSGGMVDGILHPAEAAGLQFVRDLFLVELSLQV